MQWWINIQVINNYDQEIICAGGGFEVNSEFQELEINSEALIPEKIPFFMDCISK